MTVSSVTTAVWSYGTRTLLPGTPATPSTRAETIAAAIWAYGTRTLSPPFDPRGLISYWPLNEASGDAIDFHGGNHLTDQNAVGAATGKVDSARDFESTSSQTFSIADNAALSTGDIDFTFAAWVKAESLSGNNTILAKYNTTGNQREYWLRYDSGTFTLIVSQDGINTTTLRASAFGAASVGTWYFVVAYHDSVNNVIGLSINGGTPETTAHTTGVLNGTSSFCIGSRELTVDYWDGLIDEVAFFKRILTTNEITTLYNAGAGQNYTFVSARVNLPQLGLFDPDLVSRSLFDVTLIDLGRFDPELIVVPVPTTTATPTKATLILTTFAPTVRTPVAVQPGRATLTLTTYAPTVSVGVRATPSKAALPLTTFAPAVVIGNRATPPKTALVLTTFAPTVLAPRLVTPPVKNLTITRLTPTVLTPRLVTPTKLSLTLTTFASAVTAGASGTFVPGVRNLVLTRFAPTVLTPRLVTPAKLSLTLTRMTPTVLTPVRATPIKLSLTLTTFAPKLPQLVVPGVRALSITRFAPTVLTPVRATPPVTNLVITRMAPTVLTPRRATPGAAALALVAHAPTVYTPVVVVPGTIHLTTSMFPVEIVIATAYPPAMYTRHDLRDVTSRWYASVTAVGILDVTNPGLLSTDQEGV